MRYKYLNVTGTVNSAIIDGIVLKDTETGFLFFLSEDHRLLASGWVFGGIPIALCPDETAWDNICRYNLGQFELEDYKRAFRDCGCGMLSQCQWKLSDDYVAEPRELDVLTPSMLNGLLQYTIYPSRLASIPLRPNTDYDCATQVFPGRTGAARTGSPARPASPASLSDIVSPEYEDDIMYCGYGSYHSHHGQDYNKAVNGYGPEGYMVGVELEVECKSEADKLTLCRTRSNWVYMERDGSLSDNGVEIITVPLRPCDARNPEFWKALTDPVSTVAESWNHRTTGLHVHFGRPILGITPEESSETLGKLLYFYHHLVLDSGPAEALNERVYGRAHTYHECIGKSEEGTAAKALGGVALKHKDVSDVVKRGMMRASSGERYFDINLQNSATIEFRKGKGSIKADRIAMVVSWSELMVHYVRKTKWENLSFDGFRSFVRDSSLAPAALKAIV